MNTTTAYNFSTSLLHFSTNSQPVARTTWNILWSSLTTIFACTWASCHPNISFDKYKLIKLMEDLEWQSHEDKRLKPWWRSLRWPSFTRIKILLVALIVPEFIVMWALRQYMTAKNMVTKNKGLTMTYAFFSLMGGFILIDRERSPVCVLLPVIEYSLHRIRAVDDSIQTSFHTIKVSVKASVRRSTNMILGTILVEDAIADTVVNAVVDTAVDAALNTVIADSEMGAKMDTVMDAVMNTEIDSLILEKVLASLTSKEMQYALDHETFPADTKRNVITKVLNMCEKAIAEAMEEAVVMTMGTVKKGSNAERMLADLKDEILRPYFTLPIKPRDRLRNRLRNRLQIKLREWLQNRELRWQDRLQRLQDVLKDSRDCLVHYQRDIEDKSKQDWLAKTFVLAQTIWFVVQCIARRIQHLPLTEIELITCAYATLSAAIYFFWWHKPFRVDSPLIVHSKISHRDWTIDISQPIWNLWTVLTLARFLQGSVYDDIHVEQQIQVPTFYSGRLQRRSEDSWNFRAAVATAAIFGGTHLIAWNSSFPTCTELWLWRLSALVIVTIPPITLIPVSIIIRSQSGRFSSIRDYFKNIRKHHSSGYYSQYPKFAFLISKIILPILVLLYIIARLVLLVLAFISLRELSLGARTNVDWLTFIPHVD